MGLIGISAIRGLSAGHATTLSRANNGLQKMDTPLKRNMITWEQSSMKTFTSRLRQALARTAVAIGVFARTPASLSGSVINTAPLTVVSKQLTIPQPTRN